MSFMLGQLIPIFILLRTFISIFYAAARIFIVLKNGLKKGISAGYFSCIELPLLIVLKIPKWSSASLLAFLFISSIILAAPTKQYCKLQVEVSGLPETTTPLVLAGLSIKEAETEKKLTLERIESLHQITPPEILCTLEALGYYHAKVTETLIEDKDVHRATYQIELGRPTLIRKVIVKILGPGAKLPELRCLLNNPPLKTGMQLNHNDYETYKQMLLSTVLQKGFLNVEFNENEIRVDRDNYIADIVLIMDTGSRYTLGKVNFIDNPYPNVCLERYIPFREGDPYSTEDILALQKSLNDTDLFRFVRIDPVVDETGGNTVPLNVRLKPKPKNRYIGSIGYGTDSGPRGMLGFEHRRSDYPGHRINAELKGSKWKNIAHIRYTIPGLHPATDRFVTSLRVVEEKFRDHKYSLREDIGFTDIKKIGRCEQIYGVHYLIEKYRIIPEDPKMRAYYLMPNIGYVYTNIVSTEPAQEGYRTGFSLRGAARTLASSTNFIKAEIYAKSAYSFGPTTRLLWRGEVGAIATRHPKKIALSLRYFTGGDQTVRGYGYRSLGPREKNRLGIDNVIGGRYLIVTSVELEQKIYKQFSAAVFYDVGQALNKPHGKLARGVGVGIRYATPLGPLRIDAAQALDKITNLKPKPRIHLTFGMDL